MSEKVTPVSAWESLFRTQVSIMRHLHSRFPSGDISFNEYDVLFTLSRSADRRMRIRDLNCDILLTQPSLSRLVDRLASRGLVTKLHDPDDARGIIVHLSDEGYELFRRAAVSHMRSITERVGGVLDQDELQTLVELCEKLRSGTKSAGH